MHPGTPPSHPSTEPAPLAREGARDDIGAAPPRPVTMPIPRFAMDLGLSRAIPVPTLPAGRHPRPLWRKRRFWIVPGALALLGATVTTAVVRGRHTRIIIINSGSDTLPSLTVSAAGHQHEIPPLESGASHRWVLPEGGIPTTILVKPSTPSPSTPGLQWEGGPLDPGQGARRILHLNADGALEESTSSSIWLDLTGS